MTVGFHSPLPPAATGVADYSAALLAALHKLGALEPGASRADVHLYHLGNNLLHRAIYDRALASPGVVVLHDAVLHHFFLGALTEARYVDEFVYNYGAWQAGLARSLWRTRARSAGDPRYFKYPMIKRVAERSRAVIVHNPAAAAMVKAHAPQASVHEIPHLFAPPPPPRAYDVERLRAKLGLNGSTFLFGVFGHLRESKRLLPILRAFEAARRRSAMALLIAGEFASSDLERALRPLLQHPAIVRVEYLKETEFWLHAAAVDACVNVRYPPAGETSGIAIRLMGIGKPLLLSDGAEAARFPAAACVRIDTGAVEESMLAAAMAWLASSPSDARGIGESAARHIAAHHNPSMVAARYWSVLEEARRA